MKVREFIENSMIKVLEVKASAAPSRKMAMPFRKQIDEIRLIGLKVNGNLDLMDIEIRTKELKMNRRTGDQYMIFNDSIVYNITENKIYRTKGGFGVFSEFSRKAPVKTKVHL